MRTCLRTKCEVLSRNASEIFDSFKAVLIAVYMTKALQTKCKPCFRGPKMILHALLKNYDMVKDHKFSDFFWDPFPNPQYY